VIPLTINERIALVVSKCCKTKSEFATKLNVSSPYVSELCSGKKSPSDRTITDICREFNVNELWLRQGVGEMFQTKTREEEFDALISQLWRDDPGSESFKSRFIAAALRIGPEGWAAVEKFCRELVAENEKEEQEP
jgi:transcriptional regulator with XRE-family HTH domain